MRPDIVDLREFYVTPLGQRAARTLDARLATLWPVVRGERLAGLGYALPFLERWRGEAERILALMPAAQGAAEWPPGGPCASVMVNDKALPLPDNALDRLLLVHELEHARDPAATLGEAWRVLAAGGRLLLVVPNRRGIWARLEHTPFGVGRPFSRGQIGRLLREVGFTPLAWADALHAPPFERPAMLAFFGSLEGLGRRLWPMFGGVVIVEAQKRLYQQLAAPAAARRRALRPVLAPQGAIGAGRSAPARALREDT